MKQKNTSLSGHWVKTQWAFFIGAFLCLFLIPVNAQSNKLGLGFQLGAPNGFALKYWLDHNRAVDATIGWSNVGWYNPTGYYNDNCYRNSYYNSHRAECDDNAYRYFDRNGYNGWDIFHFHADYLIHNYSLIRASFPIPVYYGVGFQYEYWSNYYYSNRIGPRGTVGLAFMPKAIPFDFFIELSPVLWVLPGPRFDVYGGLGARFWF